MDNLLLFVRKQRWIFSELINLNKLGLVGALSFFSDAIQVKSGTILISRTSGTEIGQKVSAMFLGQTVVTVTAYVVMQGIAAGMSSLCSQAYGAQNYKLVSEYFTRALVIASLTCFPIWALLISVGPLVRTFTGELEVAEGAGAYTTIFCFGYPAYIYSKLTCVFLQSQNIIFPTLAIQVCGNVLNVCFQYFLIVENQLGLAGASLSYVISTNIVAFLLFSYIRLTTVHVTNFSPWSFDCLSNWYHFLKYGLAGVAQLLMDISVCRVIPIVFIGFILRDTDQLALFGILNIVWFLFLSVSLGFGVGANIRVGNLLGESNLLKAQRSIVICIIYIFLLEVCFGICIFSFAHMLSYVFTSVEEMRLEIEFGIKIVSVCILTDSLFTWRGIFNACCLQHIATAIALVCSVLISAPLACVFSYYVSWRAAGYYLIAALGFLLCTVCQIIVLYCYNWRTIIERVSANTRSDRDSSYLSEQVSPSFNRSSVLMLVLKYVTFLVPGIFVFVCAFFLRD